VSEITDRLVHEAITHTNQKQLEKSVYGLRDEIQQLETALRQTRTLLQMGDPSGALHYIRAALDGGTATPEPTE